MKKIKPFIDTVDNWRVWKMIFIVPIFVFFTLLAPSAFISLGKDYSLSNNSFKFFPFEYYLAIPISLLLYLGIGVCFILLLLVFRKNKNKIQAIKINNYILLMIYYIFYYQVTVGLQYLISFFILRVINWLLFFCSVGVIISTFVTKKYDVFNFITKERVSKISRIAGVLWVITTIIGLIVQGFSSFKQIFWIGITPFMPLIVNFLSVGLSSYIFEILDYLKKVDHNQEYYREKYGYTVLDWYGSKSKEYKMEISEKRK